MTRPRLTLRAAMLTYVPALVVLAIVVGASALRQIPLDDLTRDPTAVARVSPFTGVLSNLGVLVWCAAAAIAVFNGVVLLRRRWRVEAWFLICGGAVSLLLLFDDLFLFHEYLAVHYWGVSEKLILAGHGAIAAGYLVAFRRTVVGNDFALLGLAMMFFALSLAVDLVVGRWLRESAEVCWEDGFKFLGIASWCAYYARLSLQLLDRSAPLSESGARATPAPAAAPVPIGNPARASSMQRFTCR